MIIHFGVNGIPPRRQRIFGGNTVNYGRPSLGVVPIVPAMTPVVGNQVLTLPINCVTISEQTEENKKAMGLNGGLPGPLASIFNER